MANNKKDDIFKSDEFLNLKGTQQKIERPDEFAKLFCDAAKSQVLVKDLLTEILREIILTEVVQVCGNFPYAYVLWKERDNIFLMPETEIFPDKKSLIESL